MDIQTKAKNQSSKRTVHEDKDDRLSRFGRAILALQQLMPGTTSTTAEVDKLLQTIIDIIYLELGYANCQLFLVNSTQTHLEYKYGTGYLNDTESKREIIRGWQPPLTGEAKQGQWGLIGWAAMHQEITNVGNVQEDSRYFKTRHTFATCSELTVPLLLNQKLIGVLDIQSDSLNAFDEQDVEIVRFFAAQVVQLLQAAMLLQENESSQLALITLANREQSVRRVAQSLLKSTQIINSQLDLEAVLQTISREVSEVLDVPVCNILLYEASSAKVVDVVTYGMKHNYANLVTHAQHSMAATAAETGEMQKAYDLLQVSAYSRHPIYLKEGWHGSIALPIKTSQPHKKIIGVLSVHDYVAREFNPEEVAYLQGLADHAAVAISNASNYVILKRERDMYRALLDNAHDPILLIRPLDGVVVDVNRRASECSGFSYEELIDKPITALFAPHEFNRLSQLLGQDFEATVLENIEARRKDGTFYPASFSATLVHIGQEKIIIQILRDLSEQRAIEQQLTRNEQLRALGQLASGVAHDFNNLLTGILGVSELLLSRLGEGEERKMLQMLRQAALDGGYMVRRLQLMRPDQTNSEFGAVEVNQILKDVLELTRTRWKTQAQESGRKFEVELDVEAVPPVRGNASELREVITNMVLNAIDAMPHGGRLRLNSLQRGSSIYLTVQDSGQGMSSETLKHLFEPFFTTKGSNGHGLGLSVSNSIIARHGGTIEVESELKVGSRFTIVLPATEPSRSEQEKPPQVETNALKVMVLDDEPGLLYILTKILQADQHNVTPVKSGLEAVEIFRQQSDFFDLVFTDLSLHDLNGWEVVKRLRQIRADIPIIIVTGWISEATTQRLQELNISEIIGKPYRIEDIRAAVQKVTAQNSLPSYS